MSTNDIPIFFFFNDPTPTEIYTLSLHDALPISLAVHVCVRGVPMHHSALEPSVEDAMRFGFSRPPAEVHRAEYELHRFRRDRKSTRLNSSHVEISYAVFCLKKKNIEQMIYT